MKTSVAVILSSLVVASVSSPQGGGATAGGPNPEQGDAKTAAADKNSARFNVRNLPADQLRDFPGLCFGSTTFRFYRPGDNWPLAPFCGMATCAVFTDGVSLAEQVTECRLPKENPKCKIINLADREKNFPACCPVFQCEEGVKLEYPTPEELQALAQKQQEAQFMAAALQHQQVLQQQQLQLAALGHSPQGRPQPGLGFNQQSPLGLGQPALSQHSLVQQSNALAQAAASRGQRQ